MAIGMQRRRYKLLLALACLASACTCVGIILVARTSHINTHIFLAWNLFLAWLPLMFAWASSVLGRRSELLAVPAAGLWLLFVPNAPYVLTDLIHYQTLNTVVAPVIDFFTLSSAAVAGLSLGFLSLLLIEELVVAAAGRIAGIIFVAAVSCLVSVGVYLGRIVRVNSWDIAHHPGRILSVVLERFSDPFAHQLFISGFAVFSGGLLCGYLAWTALMARIPRR